MSVISAGTRGHYHESLLNSSHPKKYLPNFSNQKNLATENFKTFDHPRHLGVAANPPTPPPPQHPPGVWIISNFEKPKIARNRDSSTVLYCTVLCCAVILLVSIEDMCIAHVQTNIFIIESVCDQWAKLTAMKLSDTKLYFVEFFFMYILYICSFLPHCFFLVISWERNGKAG